MINLSDRLLKDENWRGEEVTCFWGKWIWALWVHHVTYVCTIHEVSSTYNERLLKSQDHATQMRASMSSVPISDLHSYDDHNTYVCCCCCSQESAAAAKQRVFTCFGHRCARGYTCYYYFIITKINNFKYEDSLAQWPIRWQFFLAFKYIISWHPLPLHLCLSACSSNADELLVSECQGEVKSASLLFGRHSAQERQRELMESIWTSKKA